MKRTDLPPRFQHLLEQSSYATIATADPNSQPWNTPVVGVFDDELNLYWISAADSQHSQNIAGNPHVFVVIYDSHAADGEGEGLYLRMRAEPVTKVSLLRRALCTYGKAAFFRLPDGTLPTFRGECPLRVYRAEPLKIWCNTTIRRQSGHTVDSRQLLLAADDQMG